MNLTNLILITLLSGYIGISDNSTKIMMEDCHNGVDDDDDGLYDAFDSDCACDIQNDLSKSVPNSNLNQLTGCCTIIREEDRGCVDDWYRLGGRADNAPIRLTYISGECNSVHQQVLIRNTNLGNSPLFQILTGVTREDFIPDHLGFCLRIPLEPNKPYSLSIDQSYFSSSGGIILDQHLITFYGLHDCSDINNLEDDIDFCNSNLSFEELSLSEVSLVGQLDITTVAYDIRPTQKIEAIVIGQKCNLESSNFIGVTNFFRNVDIIPQLHTSFSVTEIRCDSEFVIRADVDTFEIYQWYRDSIPLSGENNSSLTVSPQMNFTSTYHLEVLMDGGCSLLGPVPLEYPVSSTIDSIWICQSDIIDRNGESILEEGVYLDTFSNQFGCDSTNELHLFHFPSAEITTVLDSFCTGEVFTIEGETFSNGGEYDLILQDRNDCDSSVLLVLREITITSGDTNHVVIMEGEEFLLGGSIYSESGLYQYLDKDSGFCGITSFLKLEVISEEILSENIIFIPNIFSPNGDGINDIFYISINPDLIEEINNISIYDRWGSLTFSTNRNEPWNGLSYQDQKVYSGIYICQVGFTYVTGTKGRAHGTVQIIK